MNTRIKGLRTQLGISQVEFGERLGITGGAVSMIESGAREPSEPVIRAVCREFGVSYDWLTQGIDPMYPPQDDSDIELLTRVMEGQNENKKKLIRIIAEMPDELLNQMMTYLEGKFK